MDALTLLRLPDHRPGVRGATSLAAGTLPRPSVTRQTAWETGATTHKRDRPAASGVQLPLLAPTLAGVRLRVAPRGLEFVLPNPSGGRGVYVASWAVVAGFAEPCVHDTILVGRLSTLDRIDPASIRDAARAVASEGHAGNAMAMAARDAQSALRIASLRLGATLLMSLARRAGLTRPEEAARCLSRDGFHRLAHLLGWDGPALAEALRGLSAHCASIASGSLGGTPRGSERAAPDSSFGRWSTLGVLVQRLRASLAEEQSRRHGSDGALLGRIIEAADRCLKSADRVTPDIESLVVDPLPTLQSWRDEGTRSAPWLSRLESTFDGWDRICLLWFDEDTAHRRQAVIGEIAILTGSLGHGDGAALLDEPFADPDRGQRLLARNERLRIRELMLDLGGA
jgi:hypothetical protein